MMYLRIQAKQHNTSALEWRFSRSNVEASNPHHLHAMKCNCAQHLKGQLHTMQALQPVQAELR